MMFWEVFLLFCHILLCLRLLFRLTGSFYGSQKVWNTARWAGAGLTFCVACLPVPYLFAHLLIISIPLLLVFGLRSFLGFRWREEFYVQLEFFLNTLIAQIKIGQGFRSAFKLSAQSLSKKEFQTYFQDIGGMILFSKTLNPEFSPAPELIHELQKADKSPQCLRNLENLRHQLKVRSIFRRKAHSALLQIRAQSFVLTLLYIGLFAFVVHKYGWKYIQVLLLSFFFFILGLLVLLQCGRRVKWTI